MRVVKSFSHKSHIVKHWVREHPDMASPPPFQFKILTRYKDALSRQIGEALKIFYSEDKILNSKSEYLDNCISRLSIEETPWEKKEREKQEDEQDWIDKEEVEKFRKEVEERNKMADVPSTLVEEDQHQITSQVLHQASHPPSLQIDSHPENDHEQILEKIADTRNEHEVGGPEVPVSTNQLEEKQPQKSCPVADPASNQSSQQKRKKKTNPITLEYNLSWFGLWWRRMEREGMKLDKERLLMREKEKMKIFLEQNLVKTNKPECAITSGMMKSNLNNWNDRSLKDNGNVIKECHLDIRIPTTDRPGT